MNRCFRSGLGLFTAMALIAIFSLTVFAQTAANSQDPLVQVLVQKGVLTADDAKSISGTPAEQRDRLLQLLKEKGVLSAAEYNTVRGPAGSSNPGPVLQPVRTSPANPAATVVPAVYTQKDQPKEAPKPPAPAFIPAVAPIRVLAVEPPKPGGGVGAIQLGKVQVTPYGFVKTSIVYDSSSPYGNDFPLPGFIGGDAGPHNSPEFHLKARALRIGANLGYADPSKKVAVTGKIEFDFEGNFTKVSNRNISSIRSSQPSLRLAYGRIDYLASDNTSFFFLAGQDWTPFGSSIVPNLLETTGFAIGFGDIYTREPMVRVGLRHNLGGSRNFTIAPEFAIGLMGSGMLPGGTDGLANQLGYGERLGPDSQKPDLESRIVLQFQADKAKGVAPAQIVFSGDWAKSQANLTRTAIFAAIPASYTAAQNALVKSTFPTGTSVEQKRWGYTAGFSIPTRYATFIANYYRGANLRWFVAGQVYSFFNNTQGLTAGTTFPVASIDSTTSGVIGLVNGVPTVAPQPSVRAQGGFVEIDFPLSRIFNAEPTGRNAGWTLSLHYGYDGAYARDVRAAGNDGNPLGVKGGRAIGELPSANIMYKFNQWVTFGYEASYYKTRSVAGGTGVLPSFNGGLPSHQWHDFRSEFATIFTF